MARLDPFWDVACDYQDFLRLGFMLLIFLFVLSLIGLWFAKEGTNAYAISIVNFGIISVLGVVVALMSRACAKRNRRYY